VQPPPETTDLLALRARPELAAALRARQERIVQRWTAAVEKHLPDADPLTVKQVRNSVPVVLEKIALALETADSSGAAVLEEVGNAHGVARFQQHYDVEEVLIEYRLLRRPSHRLTRASAQPKKRIMNLWWQREHALVGQDAQWIELRRSLDTGPIPPPTHPLGNPLANPLLERCITLREQSQILLERSATLRQTFPRLQARLARASPTPWQSG